MLQLELDTGHGFVWQVLNSASVVLCVQVTTFHISTLSAAQRKAAGQLTMGGSGGMADEPDPRRLSNVSTSSSNSSSGEAKQPDMLETWIVSRCSVFLMHHACLVWSNHVWCPHLAATVLYCSNSQFWRVCVMRNRGPSHLAALLLCLAHLTSQLNRLVAILAGHGVLSQGQLGESDQVGQVDEGGWAARLGEHHGCRTQAVLAAYAVCMKQPLHIVLHAVRHSVSGNAVVLAVALSRQ